MIKAAIILVLLVAVALITSPSTFAQVTCYNASSNPKRTDGLLTTPSVTSGSKFGAQPQNYLSGACVTNNAQAALPPFQLPTYDQLKNQYYDKSTLSTTIKPAPLTTLTIGQLNSYLAQSESLLYVSNSVTIGGTASGTGTAVIFVQGNLNISSDFIYNNSTGGVVFIVSGNIYIYSNTNRVDAFLIAGGNIYTGSPGGSPCANNSQANLQQLVINGSLISVNPSTNQTILFCRKLVDNSSPAEQINYQTKYSVILQNLLSSPQNITIPSGNYKIGTPQTGLPDCSTAPSCTGACSAPTNTCAANNGTQTGCKFTQTSSGSISCNQVAAANQPCTGTCSATYTCQSGSCVHLCNSGISCGTCTAPANTCSTNNGTQSCSYTTYTGGGSCVTTVAPSQSCSLSNCSSGYSCSSGNCQAIATYTIAAGYSGTQGPAGACTGNNCWYYYWMNYSGSSSQATYTTGNMLMHLWFGQPDDVYWTRPSSWMAVDANQNVGGDAEIAYLYWKAPGRGLATVTVTERRAESAAGNGFTFGVGYVSSVGTASLPSNDPAGQIKDTITINDTATHTVTKSNQQMLGNGDAIYYFKDSLSGTSGDMSNYTISITFTPN